MPNARFLVALLVLAGAILAACSGNFGSGTTPPGGLLPSGPLSGIAPTPSPTPNSANGIVTYGDSTAFQVIPTVGGYGGAIAFTVPSPKPSGFDSVPIGVTVAVVSPTDAPDLNLLTPGKKGAHRERRARALVYISLLATRDVLLDSFPRLAVDVPRDIVTTYHEDELHVALYNSGEKDKTYKLGAAERDVTATPPPTPSPRPSAPPPPTPIPQVSPLASGATAAPSGSTTPPPPPPSSSGLPYAPGGPPGSPGPPGSTGTAGPSASPTLPPQRITFAATAVPLKLTANRPVVFAVYALPKPEPSPSPSGSAAAAPGASASASASSSASASASAAATSTATATSSAPASAASGPASAAPSTAASPTVAPS